MMFQNFSGKIWIAGMALLLLGVLEFHSVAATRSLATMCTLAYMLFGFALARRTRVYATLQFRSWIELYGRIALMGFAELGTIVLIVVFRELFWLLVGGILVIVQALPLISVIRNETGLASEKWPRPH